ncbi:MAG: glycosyltransferase family 2 protein [Candidatus Aenigmarchaeota archaeon]|nr:glycosyltransferase family 2 protein [Candidatus Aenigmarchaeota archaeon]
MNELLLFLLPVGAALLFLLLGWSWEQGRQRPQKKAAGLVSIIIPAYNSSATIGQTLQSAANSAYHNKEIIVVNDTPDSTRQLCRKYGAIYLENKQRLGKANALNQAAKQARGSVLVFLDADTVIHKDAIGMLAAWFADGSVAAVQPRYGVHNSGLLPSLLAVEDRLNQSFFKTSMFFGTMLGFRGCCIAVSRSAFERLGGWSDTIIEDIDFCAKAVRNGYKVLYEPHAYAETAEPATFSAMVRQKVRWGKGAWHVFRNHYRLYLTRPQFLIYMSAYIFVLIALVVAITWHLWMVLPALALGTMAHIAMLSRNGGQKRSMLLVPVYAAAFLPVISVCYLRGILGAIMDRRKGRPELDLDSW